MGCFSSRGWFSKSAITTRNLEKFTKEMKNSEKNSIEAQKTVKEYVDIYHTKIRETYSHMCVHETILHNVMCEYNKYRSTGTEKSAAGISAKKKVMNEMLKHEALKKQHETLHNGMTTIQSKEMIIHQTEIEQLNTVSNLAVHQNLIRSGMDQEKMKSIEEKMAKIDAAFQNKQKELTSSIEVERRLQNGNVEETSYDDDIEAAMEAKFGNSQQDHSMSRIQQTLKEDITSPLMQNEIAIEIIDDQIPLENAFA